MPPSTDAGAFREPWTVRVEMWSARRRWFVFPLWFVATLEDAGFRAGVANLVAELGAASVKVDGTDTPTFGAPGLAEPDR